LKGLLRLAGTVLAVAGITLALDFVLTATVLQYFIDKSRDVAEAGNRNAYTGAPYHHDLIPNVETPRVWGPVIYPWKADHFGFRSGTCAPGEAEKARPAIFVIGDSFVEALGSSYEQSFTGLMACDAAKQKKAVWNLGVASYSPVIYWRKVLAAANKLGVKPSEVYVFLDLSDIDDEANVYREAEDGTVKFKWDEARDLGAEFADWLVEHFTTARLAYDLYVSASFNWHNSVGRKRARWALDEDLMDKWGWRGLKLAGANLDKLVGLCRGWQCRVTLVVYPWPDNVMEGDLDSIQVRHWRDWAARRGVRFIDGFAPFFEEPAETALHRYYIKGDVHFSEAGNRLIYETLRQEVGGDW
jgi:hypothetical protein